MLFKSLRELLLRKTAGDDDLQVILRLADDDVLADRVLESLEKMATYKRAAAQPNASLSHFIDEMRAEKEATGMEPTSAALVRDAMGHHASAYRSALAAGDTVKADKHAQQFVRYGHLAHKITRDAPGLMDLDAPDLQPWQHGQPHFVDPSKGSGQNLTGWKSHSDVSKNKGDFSWMRGAPHSARSKEVFAKPHSKDEAGNPLYHNGPYPMEHAKVNGRYISVHEDASGEHPMDYHPIMRVFHHSDSKHGSYEAAKYQKDLADYLSSPKAEAASNLLERAMDPEAGKKPGPAVHDSMKNPPKLAGTVGERLSRQVEEPTVDEGNFLDELLSQHAPKRHKGEVGKDIEALVGSAPDHPDFGNHLSQKLTSDPSVLERLAPLHQEWHDAPEAPKVRSIEDIQADIKGLDYKDPGSVEKMKALMAELQSLHGKR